MGGRVWKIACGELTASKSLYVAGQYVTKEVNENRIWPYFPPTGTCANSNNPNDEWNSIQIVAK